MAIILVFLVVEMIGGLITGSLALLADAGHMLTDLLALAMAIFVAHLAQRPATPERTFGFLRAEVIGAFVNGATLILVVGLIVREAIGAIPASGRGRRARACWWSPSRVCCPTSPAPGCWPAAARRTSTSKGPSSHMLADTLGSVGAIVAGIVILRPAGCPPTRWRAFSSAC